MKLKSPLLSLLTLMAACSTLQQGASARVFVEPDPGLALERRVSALNLDQLQQQQEQLLARHWRNGGGWGNGGGRRWRNGGWGNGGFRNGGWRNGGFRNGGWGNGGGIGWANGGPGITIRW
ncbi:rSAM-associated Gly-rich repeat secreted protein [Synechococcus sp. MEDNS5]|uniref:GrrA/OscA1 family cyclophane-containing rSAM-modified RiPP n=1 Tax=Synechococcus sp. MEDNS5 TaxID=1442554 RepID=UPI000B6306C0|nr:GrrA/OscA1 family cyclophane-containing rSAM-modified RiPP [Synechococcus sp. MEDNS5]OUX71737.1 MAG: rSAM-associated Gly-rich repeat protein [Synechococcus sp. TMED90]QNJ06992.1 rSAM-associated Gly-rich repeat secreted protein [Synechococcus sp. MEDNS5]